MNLIKRICLFLMIKMRSSKRAVLLALCALTMAALFLSSCSDVEYTAVVRSDTEWSGAFGNRTVDGRGSDTVPLGSDHPVCCVVQKQTEQGYLSVQVTADGGGWLYGADDSEIVTTHAAYGVVTVCSQD